MGLEAIGRDDDYSPVGMSITMMKNLMKNLSWTTTNRRCTTMLCKMLNLEQLVEMMMMITMIMKKNLSLMTTNRKCTTMLCKICKIKSCVTDHFVIFINKAAMFII